MKAALFACSLCLVFGLMLAAYDSPRAFKAPHTDLPHVAPTVALADKPVSDSADIEKLRRQIEGLQQQLDNTEARMHSAPQAPVTQPIEEEPESEQETASSLTERYEAESAMNYYTAARLDAMLEAEAADPAWAGKASDEIRKSLATVVRGSQVEEVTCRSHYCRVEIGHDDDEGAPEMASQVAESLPWKSSGTAMRFKSDSGHEYTLLYIAREGHKLPRLSEGDSR